MVTSCTSCESSSKESEDLHMRTSYDNEARDPRQARTGGLGTGRSNSVGFDRCEC